MSRPVSSPSPAPSALPVIEQADRWAAHATACGTKPTYAHRKALEAVRFTLEQGAARFCLPSKLVGVRAAQDALETIAGGEPVPGRLRFEVELSEKDQVEVFHDGQQLGRLQEKHARWARTLLREDPTALAVSLLQVTGGGTSEGGEKRYFGCNVVLWFPSSETNEPSEAGKQPPVATRPEEAAITPQARRRRRIAREVEEAVQRMGSVQALVSEMF